MKSSSLLILVGALTAGVANAFATMPFDENLLVNPGAESGLSGWITGGNAPIASDEWLAAHEGTQVFSTTYQWGTLTQTVDLLDAGFSTSALDEGVTVSFSQWVVSRHDAAANYAMRVRVFGVENVLLDEWSIGTIDGGTINGVLLAANSAWTEQSHVFETTSGARSVEVTLAGKSVPEWGGYFGAGFDDSSLVVSGVSPAAVPEPAHAAALVGLIALGFVGGRRRVVRRGGAE